MKNFNHLKYILPTLLLAACGGSKNPVGDIEQMRANAKLEAQRGPDVPRVEYRDRNVEKRVEVPVGSVGAKVSITSLDTKIPQFYEGTPSIAKFALTSPAGADVRVTAVSLPPGATLSKSTGNTYELKWTPAFGFMGNDPEGKQVSVVLGTELVGAKDSKLANEVKNALTTLTQAVLVYRTAAKPSALTISGLDKQVSEGQKIPFSVKVTIPGVQDTNNPPGIFRETDNSPQIAGIDYVEMDGVHHVKIDTTRANVEYLGDFTWKFNLVFNTTQDAPVQDQVAKDGSKVPNAELTHIRFVLRAAAFPYAQPVPVVVRVAIKRLTPSAPTPTPTPTPAPTETSAPAVGEEKSKKPVKKPAPKATPKPKTTKK